MTETPENNQIPKEEAGSVIEQTPQSVITQNSKSQKETEMQLENDEPGIWFIKSIFKAGLFVGSGVLLIFLVGLAQKMQWITSGGGSSHQTQQTDAKSDVVYICPMMCTPLRSPVPANCPVCGMELKQPKKKSANEDELSVEFTPSARRVANIQTSPVQLTTVERSIRTIGKISFDESRKATISAYVDGRIERLFADYTGVEVSSGDHMAFLYSPDLYAAQVEYLLSLNSETNYGAVSSTKKFGIDLLEGSREKLTELGMTDEQIVQLKKNKKAEKRLQICAPIGGTVIEKLKDEGDYVKEGEPIYKIADLSVVWLMLELFPSDAAQIHYGQKVETVVQSLPSQVFTGRIAFIDPVVNESTRTVNVRVEMLNSDRSLRPGDYATAKIKIPITSKGEVYDADLAGKWISPRHPQIIRDEPGHCPLCDIDLIPTSELGYANVPLKDRTALVVPREAVLMAGDHSVVYVETKPGHFEIRPITLGPLTEKTAVILGGVKKGEQVAIAGNFLIDSQMQLAGNPSLIDPTRAIEKIKELNKPKPSGPLQFKNYSIAKVNGNNGKSLDQLYTAYLQIQKDLAADKVPGKTHLGSLNKVSKQLLNTKGLPAETKSHLETIVKNSEGLDKLDLEEERIRFKPISHAVIHLAVQIRGPKSSASLTHFYCPMVKDGGGDWLQAKGKLVNPYFGSKMLRCGKKVHEFTLSNKKSSPKNGKSSRKKQLKKASLASPEGKRS
jgi:membrane fusion protein, copper/silver efflux system